MNGFMIMPFRPKYFNLFEYGYEPVCRELGVTLERMIDDPKPGKIITNILDKIREADIVIADVTETNPNVFFELGYAYCLKKTIVYSIEILENPPFDINQENYLIHDGLISKIKRSLPIYLSKAIECNFINNWITNPVIHKNLLNGWKIRSSSRGGHRCHVNGRIDNEVTFGHIPSVRVDRSQLGEVPLAKAISVVEFTKYDDNADTGDLINVEKFSGRSIPIQFCAFIKSKADLEHRYRINLYKMDRKWQGLKGLGGEFELLPANDNWTFIKKNNTVEIPEDICYIKLTIDSKGGEHRSSHWIAFPFLSVGNG